MVSFDMVTPDWSRESAPEVSARLLRNIRTYHRTYQRWRGKRGLISIAICKLCFIRHRFWSVITGSDIPLNSNLGGGLSLPHPTGIIIHPSALIGVNCTILHQVTVGRRAGLAGLPNIGNEVLLGAGCKILGPIRVGDGAKIGANAVVIHDVPERSTAVGVPAKIVRDGASGSL